MEDIGRVCDCSGGDRESGWMTSACRDLIVDRAYGRKRGMYPLWNKLKGICMLFLTCRHMKASLSSFTSCTINMVAITEEREKGCRLLIYLIRKIVTKGLDPISANLRGFIIPRVARCRRRCGNGGNRLPAEGQGTWCGHHQV